MPELSILIPARNEEWLGRTVDDLLAHIQADTEIIVVLDGEPGKVPAHERVRVIELKESIGQRAAQNLAAKHSTARYVMKMDAHCAVPHGFDRVMIDAMQDDITQVPVMRNLHVFNWRCRHCHMERYQGPQPQLCDNEECQGKPLNFHKKIKWIAKSSPQSSAYRFNTELQFKYFGEQKRRQGQTGLQESMSLQGSCFMATRENYWAKELCDETWGSWGQQGTEVALKTWLSGGRVMCNMDTWYAHLFRTQPGFGHPYSGVGASQFKAREICRDIFLNDKWPKQIYPLAWLLERFWEPLQEVRDEKDPHARWEVSHLENARASAREFYKRKGQADARVREGVLG
jgi:hypothetical protein